VSEYLKFLAAKVRMRFDSAALDTGANRRVADTRSF